MSTWRMTLAAVSLGWTLQAPSLAVSSKDEISHLRNVQLGVIANVPVPVPFPDSFRIDFVTSIPWTNETDSLTKTSGQRDGTLGSGRLYYDWSKKTQRIDHGPGSYECLHFYHHEGPCSLMFVPEWGMYRILHETRLLIPGKRFSTPDYDCCLDLPNLETPSPDWAQLGNPSYNGAVHDTFSNQTTYEWIYDHVENLMKGPETLNTLTNQASKKTPSEEYHTTRQVISEGVNSGRPVLFSFPSAGGRQDYHYIVDSMVEQEIDESIFTLLDGCQTQFCKCSRNSCLEFD